MTIYENTSAHGPLKNEISDDVKRGRLRQLKIQSNKILISRDVGELKAGMFASLPLVFV